MSRNSEFWLFKFFLHHNLSYGTLAGESPPQPSLSQPLHPILLTTTDSGLGVTAKSVREFSQVNLEASEEAKRKGKDPRKVGRGGVRCPSFNSSRFPLLSSSPPPRPPFWPGGSLSRILPWHLDLGQLLLGDGVG